MQFDARPTLAAGVRWLAHDGKAFLLVPDRWYILEGDVFPPLLTRLNEPIAVDELVDQLGGLTDPTQIHYALNLLEAGGALAVDQAIDAARVNTETRLRNIPFRFSVSGNGPLVALSQGLFKYNRLLARGPAATTIELTVCYDYLSLDVPCDAALRLPVRVSGSNCWIGPMVYQGSGFCWQCLRSALLQNRPTENYLARQGYPADRWTVQPYPLTADRQQANLDALARVIQAELRSTDYGRLADHLITCNLETGVRTDHRVKSRPQCSGCGNPNYAAQVMAAPVELNPDSPRSLVDGGYRRKPAERVLADLQDLISPITGVISALNPMPLSYHPLRPVYVGSFFVHPTEQHLSVDEPFAANSYGKGMADEQAKASALCEGIERWSSQFRGDEAWISCTLSELGDEALHPDDLQCFSETQFVHRDPEAVFAERVPARYQADQILEWSPAWSLTFGRRRMVPTEFCFKGVRPPEHQVCLYTSNGSAVGQTLEEAILQGACELIERDAAAIWWYNQLAKPSFDLAAFDDDYFDLISTHYQELGWSHTVLDLTTDIGIPVAISLIRQHSSGHYAAGLGCHIHPQVAVARAITEMNQVFDPLAEREPLWKHSDWPCADFLQAHPGRPAISPDDYLMPESCSLAEDIAYLIKRLSSCDLELIAMRIPRPETDMSVVKMIIPGIRHMWRRMGPGRLYTSPVVTGEMTVPRSEAQMNRKTLEF